MLRARKQQRLVSQEYFHLREHEESCLFIETELNGDM
ncbi:unnamed protein product [Cuscuta epithymum]|uniref:Uncharacterized protein n=1 Tax=Cuscuta epithymum TaxID=186058 RepID=A0AAV0FXE4_9ASTE|nr:unnamed protein product [Cuscuta epithymum]